MSPKCPKNKYCSFESVKEDSKTLKETCIFCGRSVYWNKDKFGRLDNKKYQRLHIRDFAQPIGPTSRIFREIYGNPDPINRPKKVDWVQAGEDAKRMVQDLRKDRQTLFKMLY